MAFSHIFAVTISCLFRMPLEQSWTSMRGNSRNDGYARHAIFAHGSVPIQHFNTGNAIFSTPLIGADERIYVGSADHSFYAFDTQTEKVLWSFKTEGIIDSAACMDEQGMLYVPSGDGCLYKITPDGQEVWKLNILTRKPRTLSTIYWWEGNAAIGPNGWIYAGNDDFCLYAIDPDGQVRWTFASGLQIWSAPAFQNGIVYIASFDMYVYALEQSTGKMIWKRRLENCITSSPAITPDGTVMIGCFDGSMYALNGKNGKIRWKRPTKGAIYASAALTPNGKVIIGSCDGTLYCLHADSGEILWTYNTHCPIWSSASIANRLHYGIDTIFVGDSNGHIIALDAQGTMLWTYASGLHREHGRQNDINASIALGVHGLAAASARGEVLYIPYDAYLKPTKDEAPQFLPCTSDSVHTPVVLPSMHAPAQNAVHTALPAVGTDLEIRNIVFTEPAMITPLDQIGIVSLTIHVRVIRSDPKTGRFIAWGLQTFGYSEDGTPVGIPEPRHYLYAFTGTTHGDTISLEAQNCDFEITAFPIPLDTLSFVAKKTKENTWDGVAVHGFLHSQYLMRTLLRRYGALSLTYVAIQLFKTPLLRGFHLHVASGWRTLRAVWMLFLQRRWKVWGLLDSNGNFTTIGTFSLIPKEDRHHALVFEKASYNASKRTINAVFTSHGTHRYEDGFPGILLIDRAHTKALSLTYWKYLRVRYKADRTVHVTFKIPASVDLAWSGMDAVVLINCEVQTTLKLS
jgi:outer membrane protein assembly factor BamB